MSPLILFLVISLVSIAWAFYSKIHRQMQLPREERTFFELLTIGLPAAAVLINAVFASRFATVGLSVGEHLIQMLACCTIVPLLYMHFALQIGRRIDNATTMILWMLWLLCFLPGVLIYNPYAATEPLHFTPKPFAVYIVSHGEKAWSIYTGDLIVILQALVTVFRVVPLARSLRQNGLRLRRSVYAFFVWWLLTASYIALVSLLDMEQFTSDSGVWFYYIGMTVSAVSINTLFALNFDLHPLEDEQGEVVESVDTYLYKLYETLSGKMEDIMEQEQVFRQAGYTVEDMCEKLRIDRKVLSQMMLKRYGVHFPEYLNNRRLAYAQQLLQTTTMKTELVAEESGFANRSHMVRLFKQKYGCSPSQWQKEHKEP